MLLEIFCFDGWDRKKETSQRSKVVGTDLGMTFSAIAHVNEDGKSEIIPNAEGERVTPSVILFDDIIIVGEIALVSAVAEPEKIVQFIRLQMGKSKDEFSMEFGGWEYSAVVVRT